jgi:hypothetical protein
MKKKRLTLSRETVRDLTNTRLRGAALGAAEAGSGFITLVDVEEGRITPICTTVANCPSEQFCEPCVSDCLCTGA